MMSLWTSLYQMRSSVIFVSILHLSLNGFLLREILLLSWSQQSFFIHNPGILLSKCVWVCVHGCARVWACKRACGCMCEQMCACVFGWVPVWANVCVCRNCNRIWMKAWKLGTDKKIILPFEATVAKKLKSLLDLIFPNLNGNCFNTYFYLFD